MNQSNYTTRVLEIIIGIVIFGGIILWSMKGNDYQPNYDDRSHYCNEIGC